MLTLYVQSCSGGVFQHDDLAWRIVARDGRQGPHHHGGRDHRAPHGQRARAPDGDAGGAAGQSARISAGLAHPVPRRAPGERAHAARAPAGRGHGVGRDRAARSQRRRWHFRLDRQRAARGGSRRQHAGARSLPAGRQRAGAPHARRDRFVTSARAHSSWCSGRCRSGPWSTRCAPRCPQGEGLYAGASSLPREIAARGCACLPAMPPCCATRCERAWYSARKLITGAEPRPRRK